MDPNKARSRGLGVHKIVRQNSSGRVCAYQRMKKKIKKISPFIRVPRSLAVFTAPTEAGDYSFTRKQNSM